MPFLADRENVYTYLVRKALAESPRTALDYSEKARSRVLRERLLGLSAGISTQDIGSRLSTDESVVEYFINGDDLCIFVLRHDGVACVQRPGAVPRLRREWVELDRHVESCSVKWEHMAAVRHHLEATARRHLSSLYDDLIGPVETELRGTVIFVPHGFLHGVPMHALYDGAQYVAERFHIAYTPAASLYSMAPEPQEFERPLFVAFSTSPGSSSVKEVEDAAELANGSTLLVNPSIPDLRDALSVPRSLVHMAGHAGIDWIGGKVSWIETPDGRLTSRDLSDMQIRAKTIVITGCQTARRMIQPGDEWLGLMRSFYLSGASTIVSALWDIRDETARHFARHFYKVFSGNNAMQAVQAAAAQVREMQQHPYFWAGFGAFVRKAS
jgi:CHAT domain-containing protein